MSSGADSFENRRSSSSCVWFGGCGGVNFNSGACGGLALAAKAELPLLVPPGGGEGDGTFHQRLAGRVFFCAAPMATSVQRQTHEPQRNQQVPGLKPLAVPFPPFFSFLLLFFPSPFWSVLSFSRTRRLFIQLDKQTKKTHFRNLGIADKQMG